MSLDLYYTALIFHNGHGIAQMHGMKVSPILAPDLGSGPVLSMDYIPEIDEKYVCMGGKTRRMTRAEILAADELLASLTREPERCR